MSFDLFYCLAYIDRVSLRVISQSLPIHFLSFLIYYNHHIIYYYNFQFYNELVVLVSFHYYYYGRYHCHKTIINFVNMAKKQKFCLIIMLQ